MDEDKRTREELLAEIEALKRRVLALEGLEELKAAETEEEGSLLWKVLEILPVGVWITDKEGRILEGNPAGQQIWAGAKYVGIDQYGEYKGWWVSTGKPIAPEEWAAARAIQKGETSLYEEIEIECFDKTHKIILNSALPIRDSEGEIIGSIIVNQDITGRKKAEDEQKRLVSELKEALEKVNTLSGLLPICASCKKIRDDKGYWKQIERYISERSEAEFTHSICPDCARKLYPEYYKEDKEDRGEEEEEK